jgi:hypothetical protein
MLIVFHFSLQLITWSFAWIICGLVSKDSSFFIPLVLMCIGVVGALVSMCLLGWIF